MPYPREITPDEATMARLTGYLNDEINTHLAERGEFINEIKAHQLDYWAPTDGEELKQPFVGASRIIIPLTAIAVEAVHANMMTTIFGSDPFITCKFRGLSSESENAWEKWVQFHFRHENDVYNPFEAAALENVKFGTCIGKAGYERITRKAIRLNKLTNKEEEFLVVVKDGDIIESVSNANFIMPFGDQDPQKARWCGEIHIENPRTIQSYENSGLFRPGTMEKLQSWVTMTRTETRNENLYTIEMEDLEGRKSMWPKTINWKEVWLTYDIDDDGEDEEIIVHYHQESKTLMSIRYNWYEDLHRPYRIGVYMKVENRWRGIGVCKQSEQFQRIVTTLHRQRIDAGTVANMRMFKIHKLSGYGANEPIFPGKLWFLDDMTHLEPIQAGEVYNSAYSNEQAAVLYEQQRVGVNDLNLGMPQQGTPGTATSDVSRLQEGRKKSDYYLMNFKRFSNQILLDSVVNVRQFGTYLLQSYVMTAEHGDLVMQTMQMPINLFRHSILFELKLVGQDNNKTVDRQNAVQLAQIITQYYTGVIQLAEVMQNPQLLQLIASNGITAATELMRQILNTYDTHNIDKIVLNQQLTRMLEMANRIGGTSGPAPNNPNAPGGNPGTERTISAPWMAALTQGGAGNPGGGNPAIAGGQ